MPAETLAQAYAHGPGKAVRPEPVAGGRAALEAQVPLTALTGRFGTTVARVLIDVLAPQRWEPWNAHNDHRAYPSPRSAYLVDVVLRAGGGRWPVDAVRRALAGRQAPQLTDSVMLELVRHPARLPGYGALADALAELETGHVTAALVHAATAAGLLAQTDEYGVTLLPGLASSASSPRTAPAVRSSGFGPLGLSADPRPLPSAALATLIRAGAQAPPGGLGAGLSHRLAVRNIHGLDDGWYALDSPHPLARGAAMDAVQAAFTYPRAHIDVAGMNVAWVMSADIRSAVAGRGAGAYPALLRAAGATAQQVCSAAAAAGLFCRPARSVREAELEAAAGVPAAHDFVYLLLIGRPRVTCFSYDLGPTEVPA